ncbi:hypothetical protein FRC07_007117, partial [Ceratobasidium sp. 392]
MSILDVVTQIHHLCGGQFTNKGQPKPEVEFRCNFISAMQGLTDKQVASLWMNNMVYNSPAYDWYSDLNETAVGKTAAKKWSTPQPKIEKKWPTPPPLADKSTIIKLHQAWAMRHKALAAALNSTPKNKVSKTIELLPDVLIELLPKGDYYFDKFDNLIKHIGEVSSRALLNRHNKRAMIESLYNISLNQPAHPPSSSWKKSQANQSAQQPTSYLTSQPRRNTGVQFLPAPQAAPDQPKPPAPNHNTRPPLTPSPFTRQTSLHQTPQ